MQLGPSTVSKWHPEGLFKKSAQIDLRAKRQEREGRREGGRKVGVRYRWRRALVSRCVWVQERDRQNERTVHTFPRRNRHSLPPRQGSREWKLGARERESVHKSYFSALSISILPSSPPLLFVSASIALSWGQCMVVVVELSLPREVPWEIKRVGPPSLRAASRHHKTAERVLYFLHLLSSAVCLHLSCLFFFSFCTVSCKLDAAPPPVHCTLALSRGASTISRRLAFVDQTVSQSWWFFEAWCLLTPTLLPAVYHIKPVIVCVCVHGSVGGWKCSDWIHQATFEKCYTHSWRNTTLHPCQLHALDSDSVCSTAVCHGSESSGLWDVKKNK